MIQSCSTIPTPTPIPNKMIASVYFTPHPFSEPTGNSLTPTLCLCNMQGPHKRKLINAKNADVVDNNNKLLLNQDVFFIGEFEGCSNYSTNINYGKGSSFRNIHSPIFVTPCINTRFLNTDPFVFGDTMYYSCCKVRKSMAPGDMVLFGHRRQGYFYIDTVIILDKTIASNNWQNNNVHSNYIDYSLSRTQANYFWSCKMYAQNQQLFSFIPCKIKDSAIKYPKVSIPGLSTQANGGSMHGVNVQSIFNSIVQQIRNQGFDLAVRLDMPSTQPNMLCNKTTMVQPSSPKCHRQRTPGVKC